MKWVKETKTKFSHKIGGTYISGDIAKSTFTISDVNYAFGWSVLQIPYKSLPQLIEALTEIKDERHEG